ncbi:NEW3 domain-containing protein [Streptomyces sp. NPDC057565]|uniref:NEW3 domain-containing protein n=1 Tax=Streptomyces sp. NPDC057565 TaxID=3346169 RepID=UPI003686CD9D
MKKQRNTALRAATAVLAMALTASFAPSATAAPDVPFTIAAGSLRIGLSSSGTVTSLLDTANGHDYSSSEHPEPLIKLVADGGEQLPTALSYDTDSSTYTFTFGDKGIKVGVKVASKAGYATLEVAGVDAPEGVDVQTLLWGPITTNITKTVGESVGVVRDNDFAIGIHGLNDKSVGGWPDEYKNLSYPDGPPKTDPSIRGWAFGWFGASQTNWGSILQAYTYDYTKSRHRFAGWPDTKTPDVPVAPLSGDDAQIKGSKIALFGTAPGNVLPTLSRIETKEGLIHTKIDGEWGKTSQGASQSFLVLNDLSTGNITQASKYARAAGIRTVYAIEGGGPWRSTGHYQFNTDFGGSDEGAAGVVRTAAADGVSVGVHTLSNTIHTNDSYVTPVPAKGLATQGSVKLTRPLDDSSKTVYVEGNTIFKGGRGNAIRIGDELLSYGAVTKVDGSANEYQVTLKGRGGWGTTAAAHPAGADAARMMWYAYSQFDAGITMFPEISSRLADIFNTTGIKSMSFDALEAATLAGYGTFGTNKLVNGMYREIKDTDDFISEASNVLPGTWDAAGRISWGEANHGTKYSEVVAHQGFYERNYLPNMMGWLQYKNSDTVLDQEWLLSKMAGWNAGAGLQTTMKALSSSGNTAGVLEAWKQWEAARNAHAFTEKQKTAMTAEDSYWHLENTVPGKEWNLYNVDYPKTALSAPNDGTTSTWTYTNTHQEQPLQFKLQASGGNITNPSVTVGDKTVTYHTTVPKDGSLVADGTGTAKVYDQTQHVLDTVTPKGSATLAAGAQSVSYQATGDTGSKAQLRFITVGAPEKVSADVTIDAPATVAPGATNEVTTSYTNRGTDTLKGVELNVPAPKGWKAVGPHSKFATVEPGQTVTVTWKVTPPADATTGSYFLPVQATYDGARFSSEAVAQTTIQKTS